jgi:hypothetical protein
MHHSSHQAVAAVRNAAQSRFTSGMPLPPQRSTQRSNSAPSGESVARSAGLLWVLQVMVQLVLQVHALRRFDAAALQLSLQVQVQVPRPPPPHGAQCGMMHRCMNVLYMQSPLGRGTQHAIRARVLCSSTASARIMTGPKAALGAITNLEQVFFRRGGWRGRHCNAISFVNRIVLWYCIQ